METPESLERKSAERVGFERDQPSHVDAASTGDRAQATGDTLATSADTPLNGAPFDAVLDRARLVSRDEDPVEAALVNALEAATAAERIDMVALLAGELQARRLAYEGVATRLTKPHQRSV
jgi:hypothetical protein